jgi:ribosomal protein S18 acetylase RimI-like enzyme
VLARNLSNFEAVVDRRQMEIRRRMVVEVTVDYLPRNRWEALTLGEFDLTRFNVIPRGGGSVVAWAIFRTLEPAGSGGVGRAAGLVDLFVDPAVRRRGMAVYLLTEIFRQFIRQGILSVEAQALQNTAAALGLLKKLGFQQTGQGSVFKKTGD